MAFRASTVYNSFGTASTSIVLSKPTGTVSGDLLLVHIFQRQNSGTITTPSGWTLVRQDATVIGGDAGHTFYTYSKVAGSSEPSSYTFTSSTSNYHSATMSAYSGVSGVRVSAGSPQTSTAAREVTAPTVTVVGGDILVCAWGVEHGVAGSVPWTSPASMVERADSNSHVSSCSAGDETIPASGATGTRTASYSGGFASQRATAHSLALITNAAPNAPIPVSPVAGATVDRSTTTRHTWTPSDPDAGDSQSQYGFQLRPVGGANLVDVTTASVNAWHDVAGGTITSDGSYEWRARTYDAQGVVGPWSSWEPFTAASAPSAPTITAPVDGSTIGTEDYLAAWSTPVQDGGYQLRRVADNAGTPDTSIVYYDTGTVQSSGARSRTVTFETNNRWEHLQIRILHDGLWSDWSSVRVQVAYTAPSTPTVTVDDTSVFGAITVQAAHPTPAGSEPTVTSVDVYRRVTGDGGDGIRIAAGLGPTDLFTDYTVASAVPYSYRVKAVGDNGVSSYSAWTA